MGSPAKSRVGLVGVGAISDWHVPALRAAGLEVTAVSTRAGSSRPREFAARHSIALTFDSWEAMLAEPRHWDALMVATHTDGTANVLDAALKLNVPILVEKPVAWTAAQLAGLSARAHDRVMVGFNRRFYRTVGFARAEIQNGPPLLAQLNLPEEINVLPDKDASRPYWDPFFSNSCHGLDLLRFIFGSLQIQSVNRLTVITGEICGLSATLCSLRGDIITLNCNWGSPANFSLTLDRPGRRVELLPFELATVYEGMDVVEPSLEVPVRRYLPRVKDRIALDQVDGKQKPGFLQQALAFRQLIEQGVRSPIAATLEDATAAIALCEGLLGKRHH